MVRLHECLAFYSTVFFGFFFIHWSGVLKLWHGLCHMKLLLSQHKFCVHHTTMHHVTSCKATYIKCMHVWASVLCIRFTIIPPRLTDPCNFIYCTDSNPGTGADDAFVLKRGMWHNATWPSHSRPAIAASARHFQICLSPLTFWPLVCLPTLYLPSPFYALSHV